MASAAPYAYRPPAPLPSTASARAPASGTIPRQCLSRLSSSSPVRTVKRRIDSPTVTATSSQCSCGKVAE